MVETNYSTDLIERCLQGDISALDEYARRFGPEVEQLACAMLDSPMNAQNVAQEILVSAVEASGKFRVGNDLRIWVFSIAINNCRKKNRAEQVRQCLVDVLSGLLRGQSNHIRGGDRLTETWLDMQTAMRQLDEKHRIPIILHYGHGLSVAEICRVTGVGENTVLLRLFHARARLNRILNGEES